MNKALAIMAIITIALVAYAFETAQLPPATIEYKEVFYIDNQSITFITKDGYGLFTMHIKPKISSFELTIQFPEGTSYLVRYGDRDYRGTDTFKITVDKDSVPAEVYVQFQLPEELTRRIIYEGESPEIKVIGEKAPFWHAEDVIYIKYRKEEKS
ncbi:MULTISPECIES: hypothetical protein [Thermococcus]|uniref:Uncharacterized protein n=1 Tax=Thermococcus nautili TaxID=195522 RepID=W8NUZ1_9EURY|nr:MULTISPECIES: hypothetical protein [Thermococcus]AHL22992.1 hypothetical protein BD01_1381 [Thermococcus nautili]NJE49516.1 hypothetical protein [Thermococcus sp. 9N3]CAI1492549.1 conserved exported protein of unknown function [Thermococcus nautili]